MTLSPRYYRHFLEKYADTQSIASKLHWDVSLKENEHHISYTLDTTPWTCSTEPGPAGAPFSSGFAQPPR
eukprot:5917553-Lingulodinium_polyedra.AAC.1